MMEQVQRRVDVKNIAETECIYAVALEIAFLVIGVLQRLVVKPSFQKFVLMILLEFHILCRLVVRPSI